MIRIFRTLVILTALGRLVSATPTMQAQTPAVAPTPSDLPADAPAVATPSVGTPPIAAAPAPADVSVVAVEPAPATEATAGDEENQLPDDPLILPDPKIKEDLDQRFKSLDAAGLSEDDKAKAVAFYQQAIESFDVAFQQVTAARAFQAELDAIPADTEKRLVQLAKPLPPHEDVSGEALSEVEARAKRTESFLAEYRTELAAMIAEPKRRAQRMSELPKQLAEAQQRLKALTAELDSLGGEEVSEIVVIARRAALTQAKMAVAATRQALDREQRLYQEGAGLIKLHRDYWARYVPHKEKRLGMLTEEINRRRQEEAASQAAAALAVAEDKKAKSRPEEISLLATQNKELAELRTKVVADMSLVRKQSSVIEAELRALTEKFDKAQEQDKVDELSAVNGQLLREQQAKLPNLRALRRSSSQREEERSAVLLQIYSLSDQQSELANINELADKLAAQFGDLSDETRAEIRQLLMGKQETLGQLVGNYEQYSTNLATLHSSESQLIALTERYSAFIAERVLWIRSCPPLSRADWSPAVDAAKWSLAPANWQEAILAVKQTATQKPGQFILYSLGIAALLAIQRPSRRRLRLLGEEAAKRSCTRLRPTGDALGLTLVLALPWPVVLVFLSWTIDSLSSSEFVRSLSIAIRFTAVCLFLLEIARHLCRGGGLADAHFDWTDAALVHLRRNVRWLAVLGAPLVLWLVGLEVQQHEPTAISALWSPSLGRALFIIVMGLLSASLWRVQYAKKSPFRHIAMTGAWLKPVQLAWRPFVTLLPLVLAVQASIGYYYTAQQAALRILQTVAMMLAVLTLGGLTRRWLMINRRRLAREQAKQRRAAIAAAAVESEPDLTPAPEVIEEVVDLAALSEQTQKLVRTFLAMTTILGLGLIWGPILPALAYPAEKLLPGAEVLTWGALAAFLIVLTVTYIAIRDVPALLELVILQHLPLDSGSRYAITTLCRYVLTAIGLTAACNAIGLKWGSIQWLVAAMSVGLGFGLQEIFANFVSGIILLFERPIRVGDIVTLGDKSGVVNRIRMRATTIIDWERKEYIVPNKDLVTDRLLNWTLSDHTNRIAVSLGVAYGSDTEKACQLLLESAREQTHILSDPAPVAFFEAFGDSALQLKLFCYLPNLDNRTTTIHQLHSTIDRKFRAAGLDIPFPQRDLNVRFDQDKFSIDVEGKSVAFGQLPSRSAPNGEVGKAKSAKQQGAA